MDAETRKRYQHYIDVGNKALASDEYTPKEKQSIRRTKAMFENALLNLSSINEVE